MTEAPEHAIVRRSPHAIRHVTFTRERKGWDTKEVRDYLNDLADQIEASDGERARLRAEIDRLRADLQRSWREAAEQSEPESEPESESEPSAGPDAHAVVLFSQAQQVADRLIEEAVQQARDLMTAARQQQRDIMEQAHHSAEQALAKTSQKSGQMAATGYELPMPEIEYVRTFARVAQVQLRSVLDALTEQVDRLGTLPQFDQPKEAGSDLAGGTYPHPQPQPHPHPRSGLSA